MYQIEQDCAQEADVVFCEAIVRWNSLNDANKKYVKFKTIFAEADQERRRAFHLSTDN